MIVAQPELPTSGANGERTRSRVTLAFGRSAFAMDSILGTSTIGAEISIAQRDRRRHLYIIGQTGTGKSNTIKNLIRQDLEHGEGLAFSTRTATTRGTSSITFPPEECGMWSISMPAATSIDLATRETTNMRFVYPREILNSSRFPEETRRSDRPLTITVDIGYRFPEAEPSA